MCRWRVHSQRKAGRCTPTPRPCGVCGTYTHWYHHHHPAGVSGNRGTDSRRPREDEAGMRCELVGSLLHALTRSMMTAMVVGAQPDFNKCLLPLAYPPQTRRDVDQFSCQPPRFETQVHTVTAPEKPQRCFFGHVWSRISRDGRYVPFSTWQAQLAHCTGFGESLTPTLVRERATSNWGEGTAEPQER